MRLSRLCAGLAWLPLWLAMNCWAGTECNQQAPSPQKVAAAAQTALLAAAALDEADAPVALIARVGTDLSKQGLVYSHAGFVVRDHTEGRWTVVHLLNECGSDRSSLYAQGLADFFADDLVNQDLRIVWFTADTAQRVAIRLEQIPGRNLHTPRYNLIARPGSRDYQNSTAWVLEVFATAVSPRAIDQRQRAYDFARVDGYAPDTVHVAYGKRLLGGLFSANVDFTDHPVATRLAGDYPVVTVRSIFRYLDQGGYVATTREWRHGRLQSRPGPA